MIAVGYMVKKVCEGPDDLGADTVIDVYSVSGCMSTDFADYIDYWKHNGYWFFDSPAIISKLAKEHSIDLAGMKLFYYEVYDLEFRDDDSKWYPFEPESSFDTNVIVPNEKILEGYDIVTFSCGATPECSPLSCNLLAGEIETNQHCLLGSFEQAKQLLENGRFLNSEPGPYRIFAVYSLKKSF